MQVIETLAEGLKRELKVVIPAKDMEARMNERLEDAKGKVRINGFRPGKVPFAHLKKMYGKSIMAELVNELVREKPTEILSERGEKSATQPEIAMTEDEKEADKILNAQADFEFTLSYEVIPAIELKDVSGIKVVREVVEIPESEVNEQIEKYQDVGCDQLVFGIPNEGFEHEEVLEMLELFGTKVIPNYDTDPVHSTTRYRETAQRKYPDFAHPLPDGIDVSVIPTNALLPLGG